MEQKKRSTNIVKQPVRTAAPLFAKENFMWMLGGVVVMTIGFILMAGGRSNDPNVFDTHAVYSTTRITVAPIIILAGLVIEIIALFRTPKS